uniref:Chitin-binding type-2 domain-containing protein n=1 Tax=Panagrolaimus sp. JU765 TaxID=591449 RepID=A0AC34RLI2_9BILA
MLKIIFQVFTALLIINLANSASLDWDFHIPVANPPTDPSAYNAEAKIDPSGVVAPKPQEDAHFWYWRPGQRETRQVNLERMMTETTNPPDSEAVAVPPSLSSDSIAIPGVLVCSGDYHGIVAKACQRYYVICNGDTSTYIICEHDKLYDPTTKTCERKETVEGCQ